MFMSAFFCPALICRGALMSGSLLSALLCRRSFVHRSFDRVPLPAHLGSRPQFENHRVGQDSQRQAGQLDFKGRRCL